MNHIASPPEPLIREIPLCPPSDWNREPWGERIDISMG